MTQAVEKFEQSPVIGGSMKQIMNTFFGTIEQNSADNCMNNRGNFVMSKWAAQNYTQSLKNNGDGGV